MDIDGGYFDSDPGTTSGIDAPESASSSADASTGFDFSGDSVFSGSDFTATSDPFSYYDPVAEAYFAGSPGTGGASKDYGIDYTDAYYNYVPGLASNAVARGISDDAFFAALSERLGVPFGGGRDYGIDYNERYVAPEVPVAPSDTRSLASVVAGTPPTQSSTFDRPAYGDSSTAYRQAIDALSRMGYGNMEGANPNNPTQTVDQMIAANNVSNFLEKYAPTIFGALTGFGPHLNAIRMGADVLSGKTTPGQAILGVGLGALADKIGIPPQTLSNVAQGRLGDAAGSLATGAATGLLGSQLGLGPFSGPAAGIIMKETGLGPLIGSNVDRAVTDVVPDQNWNLLNTVGGGIDQVLKDMGLPVYSDTQYRGEPITPSLPSLPGASDYGNFYESGDSGQSGAPTTPTTPEPPKQEQTITLQPRTALQPEIYQGRYGPLMRYNYVPVGD